MLLCSIKNFNTYIINCAVTLFFTIFRYVTSSHKNRKLSGENKIYQMLNLSRQQCNKYGYMMKYGLRRKNLFLINFCLRVSLHGVRLAGQSIQHKQQISSMVAAENADWSLCHLPATRLHILTSLYAATLSCHCYLDSCFFLHNIFLLAIAFILVMLKTQISYFVAWQGCFQEFTYFLSR